MAKKSYDLLFKLLLIGDSGVGKTWQVANSLVVMVVEVLKSAEFKAWYNMTLIHSASCSGSPMTHSTTHSSRRLESTSKSKPSSSEERRSNCRQGNISFYGFKMGYAYLQCENLNCTDLGHCGTRTVPHHHHELLQGGHGNHARVWYHQLEELRQHCQVVEEHPGQKVLVT